MAEIDFMGISPTLTAVLAVSWFFMLGGCIGSFMNVVIYRVPAGLSIVHPPSRCPKCENPIRAYDNIPMLGWLNLRGKCRDCGTPISARYPLVEALVALVFVAIAWFGPLGGGENLPRTFPSMNEHPNMLWVLCAGHLVLLCTLICATLIQYDGHVVPSMLFVVALVGGLMAMSYWSEHRTMPLATGGVPRGWQVGMQCGFVSMLAGVGLGLFSYLAAPREQMGGALSCAMGTASIGVLLGWQAVSAIAVVAATAFFVSTLLGRAIRVMSRVPWFVWLTLATGLYIIFWRSIASTFWWLGSGARWPTCAVAAGIVLVVSVLTKIVTIEKTNCEPENEGN